jgi:hypothetical protein
LTGTDPEVELGRALWKAGGRSRHLALATHQSADEGSLCGRLQIPASLQISNLGSRGVRTDQGGQAPAVLPETFLLVRLKGSRPLHFRQILLRVATEPFRRRQVRPAKAA